MSLILRGVDYGPVQSASGAQGFFGEGYWFHRWIPGLNWKNCTFVAKTTTLRARKGNMALKANGKAKHLFPKCIVVKPWKGVVLNSVGLSGPGAKALFKRGEWQQRNKPFFLSFMSVASDQDQRYNEAQGFVEQVLYHQDEFKAPFGLQVNLSCPNTGHDTKKIASEAQEILEVFQGIREGLGIPIVPKLNVLYPVDALGNLTDLCDAICISNTLPWGTLGDKVNWHSLFNLPCDEGASLAWEDDPGMLSPLADLGGGGLSGKPLLPLVYKWVKEARARGFDLPINAGGGILGPKDVDVLAEAGANSVFLGSIGILRGWRLRSTIRRAHKILGTGEQR